MQKSKIVKPALIIIPLFVIIYLSIFVRSSTLNTPTVLDYDPWYFFRYAEDIVENGYKIPKWDLLTYYPPGRIVQPYQGWPYTIAMMYKFLSQFVSNITLTKVAILSPLIVAALIPIFAFLLGRLISNTTGGIAAAVFSSLTPAFITVSMAGYNDTDVIVVFYMFLSILAMLFAIKSSKWGLKAIPFYLLSIAINILFIFNWGGGWMVLILFSAFVPALIIFRLFEEIIRNRKLKFYWKSVAPEVKSVLIPLIIILVFTNLAGFLLGFGTMFHSFFGGLAFTGIKGEPLIVNISVAELQVINIFSKAGFLTVASRIGMLPTILTIIGLPLLILYKVYKKEKITFVEIFLFLWALVSFYLIVRGVRFSLLFSTASAITAGYVIGNLFFYLKNKNPMVFAAAFGVIILLTIVFISDAIQIGQASTGMMISSNWYDALNWLKENADKDSLVTTWWDPGHIISGYTGLKVHADGAHCGPELCIPYNHNIRIRDMGRMLTTSNESESLDILMKYTHLTDEQCNAVKGKFGNLVPADACKDVSEVYVLATNDLIGKYFWMSCFGSFNMKKWEAGNRNLAELCEGRNFIDVPFINFDRSGLPVYSNNFLTITLLQNDTKLLAVLNSPSQGIRNMLVKDVVYYQNGVEQRSQINLTNTIDGMVWIDPSFRVILFMDQKTRDSVFTKMFFFGGRDLDNFKSVFSNPEVKIYKAEI